MSEALTTVAVICLTLSEKIAAGAFSNEGRLPSERQLSEQFSTTRITLREALSQLEGQGLIIAKCGAAGLCRHPELSITRCNAATFMPWRKNRGAVPKHK